MNETTVGFAVDVLVAGRTVQVPALMTLNGLGSHVLLETVWTATSMRANSGLWAGRRFARMVFDGMGFVTRVPEKVTMALTTKSRGIETPRVSLQEIGSGFLATGPAMVFSFGAAMLPLCFQQWAHVTGPEKPWQTGDDIVMLFLVEQDQLFVLDVSERGDVEGAVRIDQDDLITDEGRRGTEGRQGVITARTQGNAGFVMEPQREASLDWPSFSKTVPFRVLVQASFGDHQGSGTTEFIVILDPDDRVGSSC